MVIKLAQISSGAHRAQGTNWLGVVLGGCLESDAQGCSKVPNLGCEGVVEVVNNSQNQCLVQLLQEGWLFWMMFLR